MSCVFENFHKITHFDLGIRGKDSQFFENGIIYANGLNQAEITVEFRAEDKQGQALSFDAEDLAGHISFCDSKGNKLNHSIIIDSVSHGYVKPAKLSVLKNTLPTNVKNTVYLKYFLRALKSMEIELCAEINIPSIGIFNTTANGVTIDKKRKKYQYINYKKIKLSIKDSLEKSPNNYLIATNHYMLNKVNLKWKSRIFWYLYKDHDNGVAWKSWHNFFIKKCYDIADPLKSYTLIPYYQSFTKFEGAPHAEMYHPKVLGDEKFSTKNFNFLADYKSCFKAIKGNFSPNWVSYTKDKNTTHNFALSFFYVGDKENNRNIKIDGEFILKDSGYYYRCNPFTDDVLHKNKKDIIQLIEYKYEFPIKSSDIITYGWDDDYLKKSPYMFKLKTEDVFGHIMYFLIFHQYAVIKKQVNSLEEQEQLYRRQAGFPIKLYNSSLKVSAITKEEFDNFN